MIELMITVAIMAILATLAAPSFNSYRAKKQLEGVTSELVTDLQYARSEAVQRNEGVSVFFSSSCYVVYRNSGRVCTCSNTAVSCSDDLMPPSASLNIAVLKSIGSLTLQTTTLAAQGGMTSLAFDSVRAAATSSTGDTSGSILLTSSVSGLSLRVDVNPTGRPSICVPSGSSVSGYSSC